MAKVSKMRSRTNIGNRKCPPSHSYKFLEKVENKKKASSTAEKKQWKTSNCSVCMEYPHNAVLLLCSSYNKGCRPYMCATSLRYSNCLEQYKKAYIKVVPNDISGSCNVGSDCFGEKMEITELLCPLCRGQVKGWTVVEPARKYFNTKRRACMKDKCLFIGNYKELRKHVRVEHPSARPREVDPKLSEKWNRLEQEREREDVISTIQSSTPGAIVLGDYVIETNYRGFLGDFNADLDGSSFGWQPIDEFDSDDLLDSDNDSSNEENNNNNNNNNDIGPLLSGYRGRLLGRRLNRRPRNRAAYRGR